MKMFVFPPQLKAKYCKLGCGIHCLTNLSNQMMCLIITHLYSF